ncbi:hypothetical protein PSDVSF_15670 [Pseudodesulfovibrio sediminis]|uniref:Uncharacterized protein n=2 Tax=Pseudodesulfovibrio sediminis TaxID=2810563 RepID=A0ABM7P5X2_9BACT|nr:hypothetical protein PSDVSF_15670 [Pseudodesulfovibrio sediminis]
MPKEKKLKSSITFTKDNYEYAKSTGNISGYVNELIQADRTTGIFIRNAFKEVIAKKLKEKIMENLQDVFKSHRKN